MDIYRPANPRSRGAGHYRRPGTSASYCGRTLEAKPTEDRYVNGVCQVCAKAEQRDRVAAEQTVADRDIHGPTLRERAGVRYATVGKGRRVHYSPMTDETLCGREVTEYTDGLDDQAPELCAPCVRAAEERAYARALAAASPLAAAAVDLAETVEQADTEQATPPADEATPNPGFLVDPWTWIRRPSSSNGTRRSEAEAARARSNRAAERVRTNPDPTDPEWRAALAELGTALDQWREADPIAREAIDAEQASDEDEAAGTWREEWIGEQPTDDALFTIESPVEQGALFAPGSRVVCADGVERTIEDTVKRTGEPTRVVVEGGAEWIAGNCQPAEQAPDLRVIEGVVVTHAGTAKGSAPKDAANPDVIAAREALTPLRPATLTDRHDFSEPNDDERDVRGYVIDPRGHGCVALYWLEEGRNIRRDDPWHGPCLDILADKIKAAGWKTERMLRSSQCVFAYRPTE
ncbi:hypothetical protein CP973_00235 [Streptomyces albofaciens JCM 4342]|uniref:hypothetical protein n=1 Tax=Streptomyces albofaciens TaxID=66866 RepID=UPI001238EF69|nr:hypothetical protein [Streptomyces albofaciens]KAA6215132.1 hypothetical protein CP973_39820 [Streptomyces albofaciens JCM 4342]KAA6220631.1 hypothetical protein CP973_00235 [Streptomyces albofaciens JCM 4342]